MHVSIIVREDDEVCWRCKLLRLALICALLRPHVCLRCCDAIVRGLAAHAGQGHVLPELLGDYPALWSASGPVEHSHRPD